MDLRKGEKMPELRLEHVRKCYKGLPAAAEIEYVFHTGVYGLLGANGAGKTTLLRMIVGVLQPDFGRILYNQQEISQMGGEYRRILGYLPQEFGYYPNFTVYRYLKYLAELKAVPPELAEERIEETLEKMNLQFVKKQRMKNLSGGMIRRVGIAQTLLNNPDILVLDEPTAGLDPRERIRFRNLISGLGRERTVILSSHIVSDIEFFADELLILKAGKQADSGSVGQICDKIKGKVWESLESLESARRLNQEFVVSSMKNMEDRNVRVRILSDGKPVEHAVLAEPRLEDAFLYHMTR